MILTIGDEVVSGKTHNTNQTYLSQELEKIGITVERTVAIGDIWNTIQKVVEYFLKSDVELLVTTGGLGPTHDDITKEAIYEHLELEAEVDTAALQHLEKLFGKDMPNSNLKQAYFAKGSTVLQNHLGSACGNFITYQDKSIVILVGPPYEMKPMFQESVVPLLKKHLSKTYFTKNLSVVGLSESKMEDLLMEYYQEFQDVPTNPYAGNGIIRYQLKSSDKDRLEEASNRFCFIIGEHVVGNADLSIQEHIANRLKEKRETIATAESCTGGMVASAIVDVPGVSEVFSEGFITYSNQAKQAYLGVKLDTLTKYGAVSSEVVKEMLLGLKEKTNADLLIAISGISGPTGGTKEKPIGTTYVGILYKDTIEITKQIFRGNREMVRTRATNYSLWRALVNIRETKNNCI